MKYENELSDPESLFKTGITQYIHDLYRFYKLSDYKNEFDDLFKGKLDIYNSFFYKETCSSPDAEAALADYFFSKDYYDDALSLYLSLLAKKPDDMQLNEKAGYCYQQAEEYNEALKYYKLAIIIDPKVWTIKKAGLCLRRLSRYSEALDFYRQAEEIDNDDLHTALMIAHCSLDLGDYENALKYYFRIEYGNPDNIKVIRPIAWCYLATGKYEESGRYFDRLDESSLTAHDKINMGHLALCLGDRKKAAEFYMMALAGGNMPVDTFTAIVRDDSSMLFKNGVNPDELPIILDYVLMSQNK